MHEYIRDDEPSLECQACGFKIRHLDPKEIKDIQYNPYNYVVYCHQHKEYSIEPQFRSYDG